MPILALTPGQIGFVYYFYLFKSTLNKHERFYFQSGRTMSRAAYAKLNNANFPPILDRLGKVAEVIDGNSFFQFDLQKEEADMLTCNQICIQFLAFSRTFESIRISKDSRPRSVYFTFQFYRFPEYKTPW
jgi:nephrocystin-4